LKKRSLLGVYTSLVEEFYHEKKYFGIAGAAAVLLALGLVLAGCGTTSGGSTGGGDDPTLEAKQLAVDLNAIQAGTVKLTGELYLTASLTVPVGVTLDLTAEGAKLALENGATLTVDGTVNTRRGGDIVPPDPGSHFGTDDTLIAIPAR
jgi:hypothetical protein